MPKAISRALRALFPLHPVPVSTLPTLADARALAAYMVAKGYLVSILPTAHGFIVSEVTA